MMNGQRWEWNLNKNRRCKKMCGKNDMDDLFEFLGFQEALKNSKESKAEDVAFDILKNFKDEDKKEN